MSIIHHVEQGTDEWRALRVGKPTASNFSMIVTPKGWQLSKQAERYANRLVAELIMGVPMDDVGSDFMERGAELEAEARAWYEFDRGVTVDPGGFITDDALRWGGSPDGLIGEVGGLEIKCRNAENHVAALLGGTIADETQVIGNLWVSEREWWDTVAYCPGFPTVVQRTERDDPDVAAKMIALDAALLQFHGDVADRHARVLEMIAKHGRAVV